MSKDDKCMWCNMRAAPNSKVCDGCWELEHRIRANPLLTSRMLNLYFPTITTTDTLRYRKLRVVAVQQGQCKTEAEFDALTDAL